MLTSLCEKEIELLGQKYLVYCKLVATKLGEGGIVKKTAIRVFVRRAER